MRRPSQEQSVPVALRRLLRWCVIAEWKIIVCHLVSIPMELLQTFIYVAQGNWCRSLCLWIKNREENLQQTNGNSDIFTNSIMTWSILLCAKKNSNKKKSEIFPEPRWDVLLDSLFCSKAAPPKLCLLSSVKTKGANPTLRTEECKSANTFANMKKKQNSNRTQPSSTSSFSSSATLYPEALCLIT